MSGGVDSAVALLRAGDHAIGVTLRLWQDPAAPDTERACCSPAAVAAARAACHALGRPHVTLDRREAFKHTIVDPFTQAYVRGETPNPCMRCNGVFRFDELVAFTERAGASELWTGHYARVVERDGMRLVGRSADPRRISPTCSPPSIQRCSSACGSRSAGRPRHRLGTKRPTPASPPRVVPRARRRASSAATTIASFLGRQGVHGETGEIVDRDGVALGTHAGHWRYTPGQRRGTSARCGRTLYVLGTDAATNTVTVGPHEALAVSTIEAVGRLHVPVSRAEVKVRHRSEPIRASVEVTSDGFRLELDEPAFAVARGQFAVLYDSDAVVGAGAIADVA
jgi:tRNA-specific 2-thiouridylase